MLEETYFIPIAIATRHFGKPFWQNLFGKTHQKFQNDVLCGNMNMGVSTFILKFKFFVKNTFSITAPWIHADLLL